MTIISHQVCEAVSECANLAVNANGSFWDLKAILAALGISVSLAWNYIQFCSGRKQRKKDKQWEMFKDEIYSPFLELLNSFEREIRLDQLPVRLSNLSADELSGVIGEFFIKVSEMEVLCKRADNHVYTSHSNFSTTFEKLSNELDACIGKAVNSGAHQENKFEAVSVAYRNLIDGLRGCLSDCRKDFH